MPTIKKLLVANRSEIAIRVFRAATEMGIRTVALYAHEDRFALHRFKADESYQIGLLDNGERLKPIDAYLNIDEVIRVALESGADAIHPGYGFLSESPELAAACAKAGIIFVGPPASVLTSLGDKVSARTLAENADVPLVPATGALPDDEDFIDAEADRIGLPVMIKASWGGGGRGMRMVFDRDQLLDEVASAKRESQAAFGKDEVYLEKLVEAARHVEVQILADQHGTVSHLFERDCSVQRRHQKVVEMAPADWLSDDVREAMTSAAVRLCEAAGYQNAGTVEFLYDVKDDAFYFIEVNPRVQVEHTVTEEVTGIDIVKSQIRIAQGMKIADGEPLEYLLQDRIAMSGFAIQCRVTTEDPENGFIPDYGRITNYRGATGFGIRLDGGTAFSGALVTRYFDSLLEKVTAWGEDREEATRRIDRALREFRIRGVKTNLQFLEAVIAHPDFQSGNLTTRFIDETPALFEFPKRRDRATKMLRFLGDVLVNENPEVKGRVKPLHLPDHDVAAPITAVTGTTGTADILRSGGPEAVIDWLKSSEKLRVTDTTFRDAHQSLLATRMRTFDLVKPMPAYQASMKELFSLEVWGGATFDVAYRFLKEDPWERLALMREACPSILFQMLLRGSNAVGYTNYPDNVVREFTKLAAEAGVDVFRVFDSLNWVPNMRVAIDTVRESGKIVEGTLCYTGNLVDGSKYDLKYFVEMGQQLSDAGAHILAIKDMAGLAKPAAITKLVKALKDEVGLPIHFHTHDTSGGTVATVLAASAAGVDVIDAAMDPLSGQTSQPNLGTIVEMLREDARDTGLDRESLDKIARYWDQVRPLYGAFESDMRSGSSDVYEHGMPGGQYTNLRQQARAMGLEPRWPEVVKAYAAANELFGDIVKVTPSSKVVGDLAVFMVSHNLTAEQIADPEHAVAFPDSVVSMFKGELGQPVGGWPKALQAKILRGEEASTERPGAHLPDVDFAALREELEKQIPDVSFTARDVIAYALYPRVFLDYMGHRREFSNVANLSTELFFYGPQPDEEFFIDIDTGKRLIVRYLAVSEPDEKGARTVFFELNGQPRTVTVADSSAAPAVAAARQADGSANQVGAPMPGVVVSLLVDEGQEVAVGDPLLSIEAMKMETTLFADAAGKVTEIVAKPGQAVDTKDLLLVIG